MFGRIDDLKKVRPKTFGVICNSLFDQSNFLEKIKSIKTGHARLLQHIRTVNFTSNRV